MTELQWWPEFLIDEVMPLGLASPDDYIRFPVDGGWLIASTEGSEEDKLVSETLQPGGILNFQSCRRLGSIVAVIRMDENGKRIELQEPVPDGANTLSVGWDLIESSVEGIEKALFEEEEAIFEDFGVKDGEEIIIDCADWSEAIPYRLEISTDGDPHPRFVRVTTVEGSGTA